jgi:hypothetical protein
MFWIFRLRFDYPRGNPRRAGRHRRKQMRRRLLVLVFYDFKHHLRV